MPMVAKRKKKVLVADLFCGAGGSSMGARRALEAQGLKMKLVAVNHWDVAIETHAKNFPKDTHVLDSMWRVKPRDVVPGGKLDLLMASPTCTFYSRARGGRPISREQRYGRMTPMSVLRWLTDLEVPALLVENVPEFIDWTLVHREEWKAKKGSRCARLRCRPEKPCRAKKGMYFRSWVRKIQALGYRVEWRVLNAADFGDVTTRRRFFLIARRDDQPVVWPAPSHAKRGQGAIFAKETVKPWRAAREIIDWSLLGRSIFARKKPLSPKTLARIYAGAEKFGWHDAFLVILRQHMDGKSLDEPIPAVCAGGNHIGLARPAIILRTGMHRSNSKCYRGEDEPIPTVTTDGGLGVAQGVILPQNSSNNPRSVDDPAPVITSTSRGIGLVQPFVLPQHGGGVPREVDDPIPTVTKDGAHALVTPYHRTGKAKPVDEPLPTQTTRDRFGLVIPVTHQDKSNRARSTDEPLPTITGAHRGELGFIVGAFGERRTQAPRVHSVDDPMPTICSKGRIQIAHGKQQVRHRDDFVEIYLDILFRMLQPHELAAAMGFSTKEATYIFCGTKTDITAQIGNAVPVRTASALVSAIFS